MASRKFIYGLLFALLALSGIFSYLLENAALMIVACLSVILALAVMLHQESQRHLLVEEATVQQEKIVAESKEKLLQLEKRLSETLIQLSETEKKLFEQQKFSDTLAHATPDLLYVYDFAEEANIFTNKKQYQMLGYSPKEMQFTEGEFLTELLHPDDMPLVAAFERELFEAKDNQICNIEYRMRHKEGYYQWFQSREVIFTRSASGTPLQKLGLTQDITSRKNSELTLHKQQALLRQVIDTSPAFIAVKNLYDQFVLVNRAAAHYYGTTPEALIGKRESDLAGSLNAMSASEAEDLLLDQQLSMGEDDDDSSAVRVVEQKVYSPLTHKDYWFQIFNTPFYTSDHTIQVLCIAHDITPLKMAEAQLIEAREVAVESAKAKQMFLSNTSHEIRTPLNAVIGMTHLLLEEDPRPDQLEHLKLLKFSAENLLVLINDILDYSKIESGKITFERTEFSLTQLIENIRRSHMYKATDKGIGIKVWLKDPIDYRVIGDPTRLTQILHNLVSNAVKFTEQGSVTIEVLLVLKGKELGFYCQVNDSGIGIAEDKLTYVFESFTQASSDTTRKYGGTGLGLAITKRLVDLMGGNICVKSKLGQGSSFQFYVPLEKSELADEHKQDAYGNDQYFDLSHVQLLLVEDNKANQVVASKFLKKWGLVPDYADDGLVAVEKVKAKAYDIVLMDLQMPQMDGYEATMAIRELGYHELPIIALTASAMLEVKDRVLSTGMIDYISKPFNPRDLHDKIVKYVSGNQPLKVLSPVVKTEAKAEVAQVVVVVPEAPKPAEVEREVRNKNTPIITFDAIIAMQPEDVAFHKEMAEIYLESFKEIQLKYPALLLANDVAGMKALRHRTQPTLQFLQATELQWLLANTDELQGEAANTHAQLIEQECEKVIHAIHDFIGSLAIV